MIRYLLDTNVISEPVRNPDGKTAQQVSEADPDSLCTSIVVAAELRYGCAKKGSTVNQHRSGTPGQLHSNLLILLVSQADDRDPDQRRSGPHPERISPCHFKALRSFAVAVPLEC